MGDANYNQLGKAQLRIVDVVAQSIGFMGPVFSVALLIPLIVGGSFSGHGAGVTTPFAIIIAAAGTFALAWMISRYAHHIATCGALYDYVSQGVGRRVGFVAGWAYYGAAVVGFCLGTVMITAGIASDFLASSYGIHIDWWILGLRVFALCHRQKRAQPTAVQSIGEPRRSDRDLLRRHLWRCPVHRF